MITIRSAGVAAVISLLGMRALATEYRETTVATPARVVGQVRLAGPIPPLPPQPVYKEKETCGTEVPDARLVVGQNGGLANAVVYLTDITSGKPSHLAEPVKLDNRKCTFVPHVLTATVGQTLEIRNSDPFLHDAHALLGSKTLFNVGILSGRTVNEALLEPGMIHLNCNVRHTWMHAYVYVSDNPYHTVTDADGRFVLDDVPPGSYTVRIWHELLGSQDRQVKMLPGESNTQEIVFSVEGKDN